MATTFEILKDIIIEQLGVDEESIVLSASLTYDLNADSSDLAELFATIEDRFSTPRKRVVILDEDTEKIVTVQDIIDYLHDHIVEE